MLLWSYSSTSDYFPATIVSSTSNSTTTTTFSLLEPYSQQDNDFMELQRRLHWQPFDFCISHNMAWLRHSWGVVAQPRHELQFVSCCSMLHVCFWHFHFLCNYLISSRLIHAAQILIKCFMRLSISTELVQTRAKNMLTSCDYGFLLTAKEIYIADI